MSVDLSKISPILVEAFNAAKAEWAKKYPVGPQPRIIQGYRSAEYQNKLYNQPFDGIDNDKDGKIDEADEKVTKARGGTSAHNTLPSSAIDIGFFSTKGTYLGTSPCYAAFVPFMQKHGDFVWGGTFENLYDAGHYEIKGWRK